VTLSRRPQTLFAEEDLEQARRQLILYGRDGLPVVSRHGQLLGWLTRADVLRALTGKLSSSEDEIEDGAAAAEFAVEDPIAAIHTPSTPLRGYEILELRIFTDSPARGRHVADIDWPLGSIPVAVTQGREIHAARPDLELQAGERVIVLARNQQDAEPRETDRSFAQMPDGHAREG
jgi:CIC family chloride channel protein